MSRPFKQKHPPAYFAPATPQQMALLHLLARSGPLGDTDIMRSLECSLWSLAMWLDSNLFIMEGRKWHITAEGEYALRCERMEYRSVDDRIVEEREVRT